ncbi:MAG: hypothetical protein ABUL61_06675 [Oleiharenicola lentus]
MKLIFRPALSIGLLVLGFISTGGRAQTNTEFPIEETRRTYVGSKWIEAFGALNPGNNITIVLVGYDKLYEQDGVLSLESKGTFLIVKYRADDGKEYRALIHPASILLIKESPRKK